MVALIYICDTASVGLTTTIIIVVIVATLAVTVSIIICIKVKTSLNLIIKHLSCLTVHYQLGSKWFDFNTFAKC